jgi:hypothetical protein
MGRVESLGLWLRVACFSPIAVRCSVNALFGGTCLLMCKVSPLKSYRLVMIESSEFIQVGVWLSIMDLSGLGMSVKLGRFHDIDLF